MGLLRGVPERTWVLEENPLGLRTLSLAAGDEREAAARIDTGNGVVSFRIGLDGVPRVSPGGRFGLPVAAVGAWRPDGSLDLELDEIANINRFRVNVSATDDAVVLRVEEQTGLVAPHAIRGRSRR